MASNDNAVIYYESGQEAQALEAMTTSDNQTFEASFAPLSARSGFEPLIAPNGVVNGGAITPAVTDDTVNVAATLVQMAGLAGADESGRLTVGAGSVSITRPTTDTHQVFSVTVDNTGALAAVAGEQGTSFSETRGADGGPAFIPVDSIEIGQIRVSSQTAAPIDPTEIKQVAGLHVEMADFPVYTVDYETGSIEFAATLPLIHTDGKPKQVHISGFTPLFAPVPDGYDWTPAEESYSVNSQQVYGRAIGSTSISLGQAGFSAVLNDGITDAILSVVGENIWTKFKQDQNRLPYQLTQGVLGVDRTYPASGNVGATFTQSAVSKTKSYNA